MTKPFNHPASHGFVRVATASIPIAVADPLTNADRVADAMKEAAAKGASVIVFPRLTLVGNTAGDLLHQKLLIQQAQDALEHVANATKDLRIIGIIGLPVRHGDEVFDAAVALNSGKVQATWFVPHPGDEILNDTHFTFYGEPTYDFYDLTHAWVPANPRSILDVTDVPGLSIAAVIGDDMFSPESTALWSARRGATLVVGLGGSPAGVGRPEERRLLSAGISKMGKMAFAYAGAGEGESTTNYAWDGHALVYENGELLAESERFAQGGSIVYADIDLDRLRAERKEDPAFNKLKETVGVSRNVTNVNPFETEWKLERQIERFPFVPSDPVELEAVCEEAFEIQVNALMRRLSAIGDPHPVLGVSGGLDSTHALLVCAEALDRMGRPRTDILTYTLPGFATTDHTKNNAIALSEKMGTTFKELDIRPTAKQMLTEMEHPFGRGEEVYDVTFENVQAGLRTDFLFRIANHVGGIVVGTGDLSELSLGWCTYGVGDHMSHYSVNPGIPKTQMQHLIRWVIEKDKFGADVNETLQSILDTEITPELIPTREGEVAQATQRSVGPYELQDFNLYYLIGRGYTPEKVAFMAHHAWGDREVGGWPRGLEGDARHQYSLDEIVTWLRLFTRRFFSQQFKRSCMPDGPAVAPSVGLSPRGGWEMGSDISSRAWVARIDALVEELGLDIERK